MLDALLNALLYALLDASHVATCSNKCISHSDTYSAIPRALCPQYRNDWQIIDLSCVSFGTVIGSASSSLKV
jgi:hypothetical protein